MLALAAVVGVAARAQVAPPSCTAELQRVAPQLRSTCADGHNGVPTGCSAACARAWTPFAAHCGDWFVHANPGFAAFSAACQKRSGGGGSGFYGLSAVDVDGHSVQFSKFQGSVSLVINVGSK